MFKGNNLFFNFFVTFMFILLRLPAQFHRSHKTRSTALQFQTWVSGMGSRLENSLGPKTVFSIVSWSWSYAYCLRPIVGTAIHEFNRLFSDVGTFRPVRHSAVSSLCCCCCCCCGLRLCCCDSRCLIIAIAAAAAAAVAFSSDAWKAADDDA